jgi:fatty-acid desaturase
MKTTGHSIKLFWPVHLAALIGTICLFLYGDLSYLWLWPVGWVLISGLGSAIGLHRVLSHKCIPEMSSFTRKVLTLLGCMAGQGSPIFWVALHRGYHHSHADTLRDIHSPIHGKFHAYLSWSWKITPTDVSLKYAVDLLRDKFQVWVHTNYYRIVWGVILVTALINWQVAVGLILIPMITGIHQEACVNLFCHWNGLGYRNHEIKDNSTNVPLLGYFAWGQGWHNNHHKHPANFNFGEKWWEFDPCMIFYPILKRI